MPYAYSYFGNGRGPHIISTLYCTNDINEKSLLDCSWYSFTDAAQYCGDGAVAGVVCAGKCTKLSCASPCTCNVELDFTSYICHVLNSINYNWYYLSIRYLSVLPCIIREYYCTCLTAVT